MTTASVSSRKVRRRRRRLLIAALIAAAGILAGGLLYFLNTGDLGQRITPGQAFTVDLPTAGAEKMIWARESDQGVPGVDCSIRPQDTSHAGETMQEKMLYDVIELTVDGERWRGLLVVSASPAGRYEVTCTASGTATPALSIGDPPRFFGPRDRLLFNAALVGLAGLGLLIGLVVAGSAVWGRPSPDQRGA